MPSNNKTLNEKRDKQRKQILALHLKTLSKHLDTEGYTLDIAAHGRKPVTKYRTLAEQIIHSAAPQAALVQYRMLRGDIPHNAELFSSCDSVLDRVMGRARQSIDVLANEEGLLWLESIAKRMEIARAPVLIECKKEGDHVQRQTEAEGS